MKLLITMRLSDQSLWNHIYPITRLNVVESITIVRNYPGPYIDNVRYIAPPQYGVLSSLLMVLMKLLQLIRLSLIERPSLVHSYLLFPHGYLAFIAAKLTGRKVGISLLAGPVETYGFGGSPIDKYAYCRHLPDSSISNKIILTILKKFDIITVTGNYTKNYLVAKGVNENKIFILPHVVDKRFQPLNFEKDYDLVFVGRLAPVKHVETIIRAVAELKERFPLIHLAIVGDGEERIYLEGLTHLLGLIDQIDFVGFQTNVWEWYNRSKLSVLASEREGFPYNVIESLKCGTPVIISNCGDVSDIVKDSFNGRILPDYRDHNAYADVILELLTNPETIENYSKNCLRTFENTSLRSVESTWEQILTLVVYN